MDTALVKQNTKTLRPKVSHYGEKLNTIVIKDTIYEEDITILIIYKPNKIASTICKIKSNRTADRNEQIYSLIYYWQAKQIKSQQRQRKSQVSTIKLTS